MKMAVKAGVTEMERADPAGGNGGKAFDSGRNITGVTRVSIVCGPFWMGRVTYGSTIKRVFIDFYKNSPKTKDACFGGQDCDNYGKKNRTVSFDLDPTDDHIVKAVVWADDQFVRAVQFHFFSGNISPRYGTASDSTKPVTYSGGDDSQMVGMYGRFGGVMDSIGFAFASVNNIPNSIGASWTVETEEDHALYPSAPAK